MKDYNTKALQFAEPDITRFIQADDPVFGTREEVDAYVRCFSWKVQLQPPSCAPRYLKPSNAYRRFKPKPTDEYKWTCIAYNLRCGDYASAERQCNQHRRSVPAKMWKPKAWECQAARARGHDTLLFRTAENFGEKWAACISCGADKSASRQSCGALTHSFDEDWEDEDGESDQSAGAADGSSEGDIGSEPLDPAIPIHVSKYPRIKPGQETSDTHCAFCHDRLPLIPDSQLADMREILIPLGKKPHNPRFPFSLELDFEKRAEYCGRHHLLTHIIPSGVAAGYPMTLDADLITDQLDEASILTGLKHMARQPKTNAAFEKLDQSIAQKGRRQWEKSQESGNLVRTMCKGGYFGPRGFLIVHHHLKVQQKMGLLTLSEAHFGRRNQMTQAEFLEYILAPEAVVALVMRDLRLQQNARVSAPDLRDQAKKLIDDTGLFGLAMHGVSAEEAVEWRRKEV